MINRIVHISCSVGKCFCSFFVHTCAHTHACRRRKPMCSRKSSAVHVFHGVPEAPCVGPKYYTQTVAITSKPEIPHSTFLIPAARLLSWAPHEEPLLEREGSCISRSLSVCLSPPSLPRLVSPPKYLSLSYCLSVTLLLRLSFYFSLCRFIFISLTYSFFPPSCFVAHSPTQFLCHLTFVYFFSIPRSASCLLLILFVCGSPSLYKTLTLLPFPLSLPLHPAVCLSVSLSLCVSRYSCRAFLTC